MTTPLRRFATESPRAALVAILLAFSIPQVSFAFTGDSADGVSGPLATDSSIVISAPTKLGGAVKSDATIFHEICGCIGKRISIRRDSPDFQPVSWSVRTLDGRRVLPRGESRTGAGVELDLSGYDPGYYLVTLRDKDGRSLARPLRVE